MMEITSAVVLTVDHVRRIIEETAIETARQTADALKQDLYCDPIDQVANKLRNYIADQTTVENPRESWANGHHIRRLELNSKGDPKSISWFHRFKRDSGLAECISRSSNIHGRLQEWTFQDIASAWHNHYTRIR